MTYLVWLAYLILGWFTPWWILYPICFVAGWFSGNVRLAMKDSFLGVTLLWIMVIYWRDYRGLGVVSENLAGLFGLPSRHLLVLLLSVLFGLAGSFTAGFAVSLRRFKKFDSN